MLFEKIAELSVGHHKKVIAFWIVLFLASIPFFLNLSDVLQYSETGMLPSDSEVVKASEVIEEQFPGLQSNSSLMVVICSSDVTSPGIRDWCLQAGSAVSNSSEVPLYDSFLSFYGMEITYMAQFGSQLGPAMFSTVDSICQISGTIYGVPDTFITIRQGMDSNTRLSNEVKDRKALNDTLEALGAKGNADTVQTLQNYMNTLYTPYKATYDQGSASYMRDGSVSSRMDAATRSTAPVFFQFTAPATQQQQMMALVYSSFTLDNWDSIEIAKGVTFGMLGSAVPGFTLESSFFEGLYELGRNATAAQIYSHAAHVVATTEYGDLPMKLPKEIVSQFISLRRLFGDRRWLGREVRLCRLLAAARIDQT